MSTTYSFVATKPTISPNGGRYYGRYAQRPTVTVTLSNGTSVPIYYTLSSGSWGSTARRAY
ncbi:MAG: hypothetical protein GY820_04570 [Gammaproteobacteria bacterium]|nr:hypothetical protein [Gammaproteobacteria bacterium]